MKSETTTLFGNGGGDEASFDRRDLMKLFAGLSAAATLPASLPAAAQDAAKVNPRSYKVVFDNESIRVLEYLSKPGVGICGQGRHYHPAHVTIQLTDAKVMVTGDDGKKMAVDAKTGMVFQSPPEWHTTENVGSSESHAYIVEFKGKNWKPSTG
ncbi:MAG: hypothetical protein ABI583_07210 [Betaproteobacteria bacterium]